MNKKELIENIKDMLLQSNGSVDGYEKVYDFVIEDRKRALMRVKEVLCSYMTHSPEGPTFDSAHYTILEIDKIINAEINKNE